MAQPGVCEVQPREGTPLTHRGQLRSGGTPSPSGMQNSISGTAQATGTPPHGEETSLWDPPPGVTHFPWGGGGVPTPPRSAPGRGEPGARSRSRG